MLARIILLSHLEQRYNDQTHLILSCCYYVYYKFVRENQKAYSHRAGAEIMAPA